MGYGEGHLITSELTDLCCFSRDVMHDVVSDEGSENCVSVCLYLCFCVCVCVHASLRAQQVLQSQQSLRLQLKRASLHPSALII